MKAGKPSVPTIKAFLAEHLSPASRVGIDPFVHSAAFVNDLEKVSGKLVANCCNLLLMDVTWRHH